MEQHFWRHAGRLTAVAALRIVLVLVYRLAAMLVRRRDVVVWRRLRRRTSFFAW